MKSKLEQILNSAILGYAYHRIVLDDQGRPCDYEFLEVNETFEKLTGLKKKQLIGRTVRQVMPGIEQAEFDWIGCYGAVALGGGDKEFEQYSEPLKRWYRVHVSSPEKYYFSTLFIEVSLDYFMAEALNELSAYSIDHESYQKITEKMLMLSGAKYASLNVFEKNGRDFKTVAVAGIGKHLEKAGSILGYEIVGKEWQYDPEREKRIKNSKTTVFKNLADLSGKAIPGPLVKLLEKSFGIGKFVVVKATKDERMLGDFTLVFASGKELKNRVMVEVFSDITGLLLSRINAEEELIKQKEELEGFFTVNLDLLCIADLEGRFIKTNEAWTRVLGYSTRELNQRKFLEFVHPDDLQATLEAMAALGSGQDVLNFTNRYRCRDGSYRYIEWRSHPKGKLIYAAARDITQRKQAEEALREREEETESILKSMDDLVFVLDRDLVFKRIHKPESEVLLLEPAVFLGKRLDEIGFPEPAYGNLCSALTRCLQTGNPASTVYYLDLPEGRGWYDARISATKDSDGNPSGLTCVIRNITERVSREQELARGKKETDQFFKQSLHGFFFFMLDEPIAWNDGADKDSLLEYVLDHQRLTRVNQAMLDQYGAREEDLIGMTVRKLFSHDLNHAREIWRGLFDRGQWHVETREQRLDGTPVVMDGDYTCLYDEQGSITGHFGVQVDVTERKRAEEKLEDYARQMEYKNIDLDLALSRARVLAEQAEAASRAKSEFLANMSHEIRTPMNGVIGMAGLLLDTGLQAEQRHYAETIRSSAEYLLSLLNDILDFSKIEAGRLELEELDFDLGLLLDDFAAALAHQAQDKGLELLCDLAPGTPTLLRGDPGRLRQVLTNLVGNALKFTPSGEVAIRAGLVSEDEEGVLLRFSVRDTGIGIPADKMGLLFQQFSQVDASTTRQYGGTGLGLAISRQLAGMLGGEIGADSEPGRGSEFWFTARFTKRPAKDFKEKCPAGHIKPTPSYLATRRTAREVLPDFSYSKARILLAEDNVTNQQVALGILKKLGLSADAVANGLEVLEALRLLPYDLVLMDVQMPELDGLEATRRIRDPRSLVRDRALPVIAMTAHAMAGDREKCLEAGMNDYVSKPVTPQALAEVLARWLPREAGQSTKEPAVVIQSSGEDQSAGPPVWDRAGMLGRLLDDQELAATIVRGFLADLPRQIEILRGFLQAGDAVGAGRQAHSIKGASAVVGAERLRALAGKLEQAGRKGELPGTGAYLTELNAEFEQLRREMERIYQCPQ